jgi:hypothetical protein
MTSKQIISGWIENVLRERQQNRVFPNIFLGHFEADILEITKAGYSYEYEVKVSRADFKQDVLKRKYNILKHDLLKNGSHVNYFSYVVPEGLILIDEVPEFAGLIYVKPYEARYSDSKGTYIKHRLFTKVIKSPVKLSKDKFAPESLMKCYESTYYRFHARKESEKEYVSLVTQY